MLNDFAEGAKHMVLKLEYIQHTLLNVASAWGVRRLQNTTKWRESELKKKNRRAGRTIATLKQR